MTLICQNIDLFNRQRDMDSVIINEIQRFDQPMTKMFFEFLLKRHTNKYFFVVDLSCNGKPDAHLFAGENSHEQVRIFTIAVAENYEGLGWGKKLIQHLFSSLGNDNKEVILEVNERNKRAIALYKSLKFTIYGTIENYYGEGTTAIQMKKSI